MLKQPTFGEWTLIATTTTTVIRHSQRQWLLRQHQQHPFYWGSDSSHRCNDRVSVKVLYWQMSVCNHNLQVVCPTTSVGHTVWGLMAFHCASKSSEIDCSLGYTQVRVNLVLGIDLNPLAVLVCTVVKPGSKSNTMHIIQNNFLRFNQVEHFIFQCNVMTSMSGTTAWLNTDKTY
jgi:hypothetical protein